MSASRQRAADQTDHDAERWATDADLHARILMDMIARPEHYGDVPDGCTLILVPDDDPAHAEWAIRQGAKVARRGTSVYLRRITEADLPAAPAAPDSDPVGSRRIDFAPDGSVRHVQVKAEDGVWREVEPTIEDAAGLPPLTQPRER